MKPTRLLRAGVLLAAVASPRGLAGQPQQPVRRDGFYTSNGVDDLPHRLAGPPVAYPASLLRATVHPAGLVRVAAIVDTSGRVEPGSVEVLSTPDSALAESVREMMLATQFSPGRLKGVTVRVMIQMAVDIGPPRFSAAQLVGEARAQLATGRADSARTLLALALDSALSHPTEGERAYGLLVRGIAESRAGQDSTSRADLGDGVTLIQSLIARGVDLAPVLRRLADSVRLARRAASQPKGEMPGPTTVGVVDEPPALVTHPAIRYPPEMQTLRIAATVVVEAAVDATGHVEPGSARVVQSPNHAFDQEALRVVRASTYRPARSGGRAVRVVIRQPISFANY
jgi:TonB family protein